MRLYLTTMDGEEFTRSIVAGETAPLVLDSATQRLGRILAALSAPAGDGQQMVTGLTHEDLAKMIGATRTWVSLTLAEFERRGLLVKKPGRILILDAPGLTRKSR